MGAHVILRMSSRTWLGGCATVMFAALTAQPALAQQQSVRDVLEFVMTNRSIPTEDFVRDERAAEAASDAIARLLTVELATLPISSSASGFVYRFDPTIGTASRISDSFGPFFTERAMTTGESFASFSVSFRTSTFEAIDGRDLRDGTLVSTASVLRGETQPFDVETVSLRVHMDTVTVAGSYGVTDQLELSAALPIVRLTLSGERYDTYFGRRALQAIGSASASGVGDVVVRAKYNLLGDIGRGVAVGGEARLPTGNEEQLLGAGRVSIKPRLLGSLERSGFSLDGDVGYTVYGFVRSLEYSGALSVVATPRLTLIGELFGRRLQGVGSLVETTLPHPRLINIDTLRLTAVDADTNRLTAVAGAKWNIAGGWLISGSVVRTLTSVGLNAGWVPAIHLDYAFGR